MTDNLLSIPVARLFDDQGNPLLVCKRGARAFMLPDGRRESSETSLVTLQRELLEELRLPTGVSTFEHLGNFQTPAANEANTRVDADIYVAHLPHAVCAQTELEGLAWLVSGQAQPDNPVPLLCDHILPVLTQCIVENPETQAEHRTRPDHVH